jgi:transposase
MGVKLTSVIAYLRTVMRLPVRQIQAYLATLHGLTISSGEIVELLHRVKDQLHPLVAALKQEIRVSPAVQADETGWREDGRNGYIWSVSTRTMRYYEYHHSRGSEVVKHLLGESFERVLGSDFLASYNIHQGLHQRCWVHLLRDGHDLKEQYADDAAVQHWFTQLKALYERACAYAGPDAMLPLAKQQVARRQQQRAFEQELMQLCAPYVGTSNASYRNCSSSWPGLKCPQTIIWPSAVCAHSSLHARSVVAHAVPKVPTRAWISLVSLVHAPPRGSTRSSSAWPRCPNYIAFGKREQYPEKGDMAVVCVLR